MSSQTVKTSQKITALLVNIVILSGLLPSNSKSAYAQTTLACPDIALDLLDLGNNAAVRYQDRAGGDEYGQNSNQITVAANPLNEANLPLRLVALGIEDLEGNTVTGLGAIALDLERFYQESNLEESVAQVASIATIARWSTLSTDASSAQVVTEIRQAVAESLENSEISDSQNLAEELDEATLLSILGGFGEISLASLGLPNNQIELIAQTSLESESAGTFVAQIQTANQTTADTIDSSTTEELLTAAQATYQQELNSLSLGEQNEVTTGSKVKFKFRLDNQENQIAQIELPNAARITESGLTGAGTITGVTYLLTSDDGSNQLQDITEVSEVVSIPPQASLELNVEVEVGETSSTEVVSLEVALQPSCGAPVSQALNILPPISQSNSELIDPLGTITGCAGELLADYQGFSVALFDPDPSDLTGSTVNNLTVLTETELPNDPDNDIPEGVEPNSQNSNPFFLVNSDLGRYSFLFDDEREQLLAGATYILVVTPPDELEFDERRVKLEIGDRNANIVEYTATSLDGRPISASDGQTTVTGEIVLVENAERVGLDLAVLDLATTICDAQEIQITKTGDRATAEPGDTVLYRLSVRNLASAPLEDLEITDILPSGFQLEEDSFKAELQDTEIDLTVEQNGRTVNIIPEDLTLEENEVINLIYAAQVTPNALRGSGRNSATVNATRTDNSFTVQDGPAIHTLLIEPGIIEDAGTLIGRVFVDKNFDGEQQPGEPGIPNAVIYLEDGNRVITDPDGLFSVTNVLPGIHTGTLDLTSIPEYRLAPNIRFIERNSTSRLVQLEPGGMVRMNFGVTPTAAGKATELPSKKP